MYRLMNATTGKPEDGRLSTSWMASGDAATGLGINFDVSKVGRRIGTPGTGHFQTSAEKAAADAQAALARKNATDVVLKGHVGAAGKATTWGDLKTQK